MSCPFLGPVFLLIPAIDLCFVSEDDTGKGHHQDDDSSGHPNDEMDPENERTKIHVDEIDVLALATDD